MTDAKTEQDKDSEISKDSLMPKLYINGFAVGMSLSDMYIVTEIAGSPSHLLLMSFTTAKTLVQQLGKAVSDFEEMTGQKLLTMDDIQKAAAAKAGKRRKK